MDAKKISKELKKFRLVKDQADEVRRVKAQAINMEHATVVREGVEYEDKLMGKVVTAIRKYIDSKAKCECQRKYPDQIELQVDGAWIFFDADHPNDCRDYVIPYAELNT